MKVPKAHIRRSSGNVFTDLGFGPSEAEDLKLRSDRMIRLTQWIEEHRLSRADAAWVLGASEAAIRDLLRGRIERFSAERLAELVGRIEGFTLGPDAEAELLEAIAEADRGECIPAEDLLRQLRATRAQATPRSR